MNSVIQMFNVESENQHQNDSLNTVVSFGPSLSEPRTSHYTIYVDLPNDKENVILIHGYLGHRMIVTHSEANYLRSLETKNSPRPLYGEWSETKENSFCGVKIPSKDLIEKLIKKGFLTRRSYDEELEFFKKYVEIKTKKASRKMPFYLFMPTYDCNLRCPYCFQDHMRKDESFSKYLKVMDEKTVDMIFSVMPDIEQKHGYDISSEKRHRDISFFGGEPFLKKSRHIIEYIIKKANEIGTASFSATTNATEIDAYEDLLGEHCIKEIQVTLDGKPEEHDKRRIYPDGKGSFSRISDNIRLALDKGVTVSVRINVDYGNINDLPELADLIIKNEWTKSPRFNAYLAPIRSANEQTDEKNCMTTRRLNDEINSMRKIYPQVSIFTVDGDLMKKKQVGIFLNKNKNNLKTNYCGAHGSMYLFDSQADIYACWEKTGDKKIRIGTIDKYAGLLFNKKEEINWRSRTVASNPVCAQCRYAMHCGGGCAVIAEEKSGMLHSNYCDSFGKRFRTSVAEAYENILSEKLSQA